MILSSESRNKRLHIAIDGRNFFDQPVKNDLRTYGKMRKTTTVWGHDYATGCLVDYSYFK